MLTCAPFTALEQVVDGVTTFDSQQNVVMLDEENQWVYFVIESAVGVVSQATTIHLTSFPSSG